MSHGYRFISWTPFKRRYDVVMAGLIALYLLAFFVAGKLAWRGTRAISDEILLIRATGTCAILLLHIVLCIGPLARLDRRFLPVLYNRRHLGVTTCLVALLHAVLTIGYYHGFGEISPLASLFTSSTQYRSISAFPFEMLGLLALVILIVMAATSHDLWLARLTPRVWKALHMLVYVAWAAAVMHVALGALQSERHAAYAFMLAGGVLSVSALHILAGWRGRPRRSTGASRDGWLDAGSVASVGDGRGTVLVAPGGTRIAVFRQGNRFSAVSNVCAHQGGPLGEGRIIDGCITCPWHGYQYRAEDGCAPPPFTEKLPTYPIRIDGDRVLVNPQPLPPGTLVEPATLEEERHAVRAG
jgi:methionine sulfoxide reductase heme-binding subunit